jgi:hypothetical protein
MIPGDEIVECPACGKPIVVNEAELYIFHSNPPCEWFCVHAEVATNIADIRTQQETKILN